MIEAYSFGDGVQRADALIVSTALEYGMDLVTANDKHYRPVDGLVITAFRP